MYSVIISLWCLVFITLIVHPVMTSRCANYKLHKVDRAIYYVTCFIGAVFSDLADGGRFIGVE